LRHIEALGIKRGWRCWEVGAGGPSVPGWLAEQVAPEGYVLASDIDVSWMT
jgi:precorrin-6B methylase 2